MDRAVSIGLALTGQRWNRPVDTVGLAGNVGWISAGRQRYLEAGGIGIITGDGRLNYRPEFAIETYYDMRVAPGSTPRSTTSLSLERFQPERNR